MRVNPVGYCTDPDSLCESCRWRCARDNTWRGSIPSNKSLSAEVEDLRAVLDATDGDATIFGHSFAGLVALATAAESDVERLVLYELSLLVNEYRGENLAAQMQQKLDAEERKEAMKLFFWKSGGVPAPEQLPIWPDRVRFELVETVVHENETVESFNLPAQPDIDCPTLGLTDEQGPKHLHAGVETLLIEDSETLVSVSELRAEAVQHAEDTSMISIASGARQRDVRKPCDFCQGRSSDRETNCSNPLSMGNPHRTVRSSYRMAVGTELDSSR